MISRLIVLRDADRGLNSSEGQAGLLIGLPVSNSSFDQRSKSIADETAGSEQAIYGDSRDRRSPNATHFGGFTR